MAGTDERRLRREVSEEREQLADAVDQLRTELGQAANIGGRLRSEWTCEIPMFNAPMRGVDLLTLRDGRIARLETTVTEFPPVQS